MHYTHNIQYTYLSAAAAPLSVVAESLAQLDGQVLAVDLPVAYSV